jgi:hypothetical protein
MERGGVRGGKTHRKGGPMEGRGGRGRIERKDGREKLVLYEGVSVC